MAPSTNSPSKATAGRRLGITNSREGTPTMARPGNALKSKNDAQLATSFKTDLSEIRNLVTCTVCDLLLYEPWTLACGHTYCYSCLCNWFDQHKHKKTCPECRAKVTKIPSPNFIIKQMVDQVFTKRRELMPADESIEQHAEKRAEEIATVEKDKTGPNGVFRGLFPESGRELMIDDADGVVRCPGCGHEHIGGPACTICGLELLPYDFSDLSEYDEDLDALEDLELDLDAEVDAEFAQMHGHHRHHRHFHGPHALLETAVDVGPHQHIRHHAHHHYPSNSEDESELDDSDEDDDEGSLQDFVVQDDEEPNRRAGTNSVTPATNLVSDEEDSDGSDSEPRPAIRRRRVPRSAIDLESSPEPPYSPRYDLGSPQHAPNSPHWGAESPRHDSPSLPTVNDTNTDPSEAGDMGHADELLRHAGWSPLHHDDDSDVGEPVYRRQRRDRNRVLDTDSEDNSDANTETLTEANTEHGPIDDYDERSRDSESQTPTLSEQGNQYRYHIEDGTEFYASNTFEYQATDDDSSIMDHDGDTDMSRDSRSVSANPYFGNILDDYGDRTPPARVNRGVSIESTESSEMDGQYDGIYESRNSDVNRNLGVTNNINQIDADSSDSSIHPPPRRQGRRPHTNVRVQQFDPRISMMFAEHQAARVTGSLENPVSFRDDDDEDEVRYVEPASRNRRITACRNMPARRYDPLRSSRSPSSTRVISSSQRNSRLPRQYSRRG
ncbi:RING/U-box [Diplocarpon rosae]|nr:RING/U-box [Diplocarpon rosae]